MAEAQAMLSSQQKDAEQLSPIAEISEERSSSETQKRKNIVNFDVDAASLTTLSPRQRISDVSDVHCSGSPLMIWLSPFVDVISFASLQNSSIEYLAYMVPVLDVSIVVQTSNEMDVQQVILMFQSFKALCSLYLGDLIMKLSFLLLGFFCKLHYPMLLNGENLNAVFRNASYPWHCSFILIIIIF